MRPGMISKDCLAILQFCTRVVPDKMQAEFIALPTSYLRPRMMPSRDDVRGSNYAREKLGLGESR
jgi:hypothetical protein